MTYAYNYSRKLLIPLEEDARGKLTAEANCLITGAIRSIPLSEPECSAGLRQTTWEISESTWTCRALSQRLTGPPPLTPRNSSLGDRPRLPRSGISIQDLDGLPERVTSALPIFVGALSMPAPPAFHNLFQRSGARRQTLGTPYSDPTSFFLCSWHSRDAPPRP